jgi:glutamate-ammonia-ligase adenylyltransferase
MHNTAPLADRFTAAPRVAERREAKSRLADLARMAREEGLESLLARMQSRPVADILLGLADHSPYLWRLASFDAPRLQRLLDTPPHESVAACLATLRAACDAADNEHDLMRALRLAKQETHLLIALADIGGVWDVVKVTRALSDSADAFVSCALRYLLREAARGGKLTLADADDPEKGCGLVILALGKHGARELNYSSDVDLVVFFDPESPALTDGVEPAPLFVRITKSLSRILQERTGDGYVLRVDLRLRPDPGSTAVAIALPAAFTYYETVGQNWERAALIKARSIAGDTPLGDRFMADLAPFIWRKYFDYAAIADVHAMKRQIHAVRGHSEVKVEGHDVKLGRGGIREIEFFVQTQQLIFGGRRPKLRGSRTLDMLVQLHHDGWVTADAVKDLSAAYAYLRTIEHRLQMVNDEQTQRLPADEESLTRFAKFCGYPGLSKFSAALTSEFHRVEAHYARLFEHAPGLDAAAGNLVFTGVSDDPETLETLRGLGFHDPALAAETVRGWHFGRRAAVQSARAREVLTELVPALLEAFSGSGDPDAALVNFDQALGRMPAAVELFSILKSNVAVRELFGDILGGAPRLANVIAMRPHVLDAAIDPDLLNAPTSDDAYDRRARHLVETFPGAEDFLDAARILAQEEIFLIGLRLLSGMIDPRDAGLAYTALAASLVRATYAHVEANFAREYGQVPGGRVAVLAMGKLGSREMTATSDLDLILLYDFDAARAESEGGGRSLHAVQYYTRLTQRLITALTTATRRGRLYEVDMRLRPSGNKGPVATQLQAFRDYQANEAETWERMALTRGRFIAGDASLGREAESEIVRVLSAPRDAKKLSRDVFDMRGLIAQEKGDANPWDLKLAAGGVIDVEFIAQYLLLRHAAESPDIVLVATEAIIARAGEHGFLSEEDVETLTDAHRLYSNVTQMLRLTLDTAVDPATAGQGVKRRIANSADVPDFQRLERELAQTRARVRSIFNALLDSKSK